MNRLPAHIARLTRSIFLEPDESGRLPSVQFIAGRHLPSVFPSGFGLSWWFSKDIFRATETITSLIIDEDHQFKDCDRESVSDVITSTLQKVCLDRPLFNPEDVLFRRKPNLFECRGPISVAEFASSLLGEIKNNLRSVVGKRCTVYPLVRFRGPSFSIKEAGIHVIAQTDASAWSSCIARGYESNGWSPQTCSLDGGSTVFPHLDFDYVIVAEEYGTQKGARFASTTKFRTFISLLFAIASQRSPHSYFKAMAQPFTACIQFPHVSAPDHVITQSYCGALSPYYTSDIPVDNESIERLKSWYHSYVSCPIDFMQRLEKSTYFVNRGMNSEDIEAYINYFVALDALFGKRGSVEASITNGVCSLALGDKFEQKISWLFDLRNELVHGGSRYVTEWPKYQRYVKHFESNPLYDISALSQAAILEAPHYFAT